MPLKLILFIFFVLFNALDYYITRRVLDHSGRELNPVVRYLGLLPAKLIGIVLFGFVCYFFPWPAMAVGNILMAVACVWNYFQLKK